MSRIALSVMPFAGHVAPVLAVAEELTTLGGTGRAVELIERLIETGEPVRAARNPWDASAG